MQNIIELWRGSITTRDGALQLLLIVDYIVDWARDVYRENIITDLRSLASGDNDAASTFYPDTDIFSTAEINTQDASSLNQDHAPTEYNSNQRDFAACDSMFHAVRHGSFVESRFRCVLITRDNVRTMLHLAQRRMTQMLCSAVLSEMKSCLLLQYEAIEAIEAYWTGTSRSSPKVLKPDDQFFAVVGCSYSISPSWYLVRELHVFAIAEDAWEAFAAFSSLRSDLVARPTVSEVTDALDLLHDLKWCTRMDDTLLLCINRFCRLFSHQHDIEPDWANGMLRAIVNYTYAAFQKESADARATFLKSSTTFVENDKGLRAQRRPSYVVNFFGPLDPSEGEAILVHAGSHGRNRDRSSANICLYILSQTKSPPPDPEITRLIKQTYATRDVYHSTRDNGPEDIELRTLAKWNLRREGKPVYGLCLTPETFMDVLLMLDGYSPPARQGSPRVPDGAKSGLYLYKRCFDPWGIRLRGNRLHDGTFTVETQMFLAYKIISAEVQYWKQVATQRQSEGSLVCSFCAEVKDVVLNSAGLCQECTRASVDDTVPGFLQRLILGEPPIRDTREGRSKMLQWLDYFPDPVSEHWDDVLGKFTPLELPFNDLEVLYSQCRSFHTWHNSQVVDNRFERSREWLRPYTGLG